MEDYYAEEKVEKPAMESPEEEGEETALLPLSMFPEKDLKVGSKCSFEVVAILDDEVEVKYSKSEKDEPEEKVELSFDEQVDAAAAV